MRIVRGHLVPGAGLRALDELRREMERVFDEAGEGRQPRSLSAWNCPGEAVESGDEIRFAVELPGVRPDEVDLTVEDRVISISGEKHAPHAGEAGEVRLDERCYGHFERSFALPETADTDAIEASFDHGVLTVVVPKRAESKARRIEIGGSAS